MLTLNMPIVYWIHYPEHTDPLTDGYVGVTDDFEIRLAVHKRNARKNPISPKDEALIGTRSEEIVIETIFEGSASECADEEIRLRPRREIGWNISPGGSYNRRTQQEKLFRRLKQGWITQRQYDLLIKEVNNPH